MKIKFLSLLLLMLMGVIPVTAQVATPEVVVPEVAETQTSAAETQTSAAVNDLTVGLFGVIGVLLALLAGAGVSIHNSLPLRLALSAGVNLAKLTPSTSDDRQLKEIANQQGLVQLEAGGVTLLIPRAGSVTVDGTQVYPPSA